MTRSAVALLCAYLLAASGCETLGINRRPPALAEQRIVDAQKLIRGHRYDAAVAELQKVADDRQSGSSAPEAKYLIAAINVSADNPDKNYAEALAQFDEFLRLYPNHELALDARNWQQALKLIVEMKKENERLSKNIERLKQLDVRQEEKRLGR